MYPTLAQRDVLRNWFGGHRFIYNACVAFYKHAEAIKKKEKKENIEKSKRTAFSMGITPLSQRFVFPMKGSTDLEISFLLFLTH